ncbi:MAG TPA: TlyA family RNA methyltransferase [Dehalococcoidales bacterium]|nr:TlyA family RNA methyltransferase [Dehalococcoidales bacterium]
MAKRRIDSLLLERGLVESRAKAQSLIMAGEVTVAGQAVIKSGTLVPEDAEIAITKPPPFVSRGGLKLEHALDRFQLDVAGKIAADIGASTGGFTDCLLQRGAKRVYAVDVGYGQLDYHLRKDPRVVVMERVNARYPIPIPEKIDLATIDVSFISVEKVILSVTKLLNAGGYIIVLLKPQFEARREEVGKGGIIKESAVHARVLGRFIAWLSEHDFRLNGLVASPVLGASGNREFLLLIKKQPPGRYPR